MSLQTRLSSLITAIGADVKQIQTELAAHNWVQMTQAQYDVLAVKDPNTLYVIVG